MKNHHSSLLNHHEKSHEVSPWYQSLPGRVVMFPEMDTEMGVSENRLNPCVPNGFADHYPVFKWLAIIGNINPTFSDKPKWGNLNLEDPQAPPRSPSRFCQGDAVPVASTHGRTGP